MVSMNQCPCVAPIYDETYGNSPYDGRAIVVNGRRVKPKRIGSVPIPHGWQIMPVGPRALLDLVGPYNPFL